MLIAFLWLADVVGQFDTEHKKLIHAVLTYPEHQQYDEVVAMIQSFRASKP